MGWNNFLRAGIPEKPATAILFPWKACQREITWNFDAFPFSTQYCLASLTASSVESVPESENQTRAIVLQIAGGPFDDKLGKFQNGIAGKSVGRGIRNLFRLFEHGRVDFFNAVANGKYKRKSRRIHQYIYCPHYRRDKFLPLFRLLGMICSNHASLHNDCYRSM